MGMSLTCRKGLRPQRQPPVGSPALLLSPLGSTTSGSSGREVMKSAGAGRISSSRPTVGREKHVLLHAWFAFVCLRAGLQRELAQLRMGPGMVGKVSQAGCTVDVSLLGNSVLTLRVQGSTTHMSRLLWKLYMNNRADTRHGLSLTYPSLHGFVTHLLQPLCSVPSCNLKYNPGLKVSICKHRGTAVPKLQANIWLHSVQFKEYPAQTPPFCPTAQALHAQIVFLQALSPIKHSLFFLLKEQNLPNIYQLFREAANVTATV